MKINHLLWFDVESRYEATFGFSCVSGNLLWFDVESRYEATEPYQLHDQDSCGLV